MKSVQDDPSFFVWLHIFNLPYVLSLIMAPVDMPAWKRIFFTFCSYAKISFFVFAFDLLFRIIPASPVRKVLQRTLLGISVTEFILDIVMLSQYSVLGDGEAITFLFISSPREVVEFITHLLANPIIFIAGGLAVFALYLFHKICCRLIRNTVVFLSLLLFSLSLALVPMSGFAFSNSFFRFVQACVESFQYLRQLNYMHTHMTHTYVPSTLMDNPIPYVIFVLGESTSRTHMNLYGYHLPNTPHMNDLQSNGSLFVFDDVISPHSHTENCVAPLLSFSNYENNKPWYETANLLDIVRSVGYKTQWIANQDTGAMFGSIPRIYRRLCDVKRDVTIDPETNKLRFESMDDAVLPALDDSIRESAEKNFILLHLIGTHFEYNHRYPIEFARFAAVDTEGKTEQQRLVLAQYSNAILFNDHIINEIISRFKDKNAVVIYLSDHGEEVYDDPHREYVGHDEYKGSFYMIEIPMMIWTSDKFKELYPQKVEQIRSSINRPYMTDDMIHTVLDLMGISTEGYSEERSVINKNFNSARKRIYKGRDYDKFH